MHADKSYLAKVIRLQQHLLQLFFEKPENILTEIFNTIQNWKQ